MLRLALHAMGTRFEFAIAGEREGHPADAFRPVAELALDEIRVWHERLSKYQPDSWVRFAEREGPCRDLPVDADLFELLSTCRDVWRASGGAFDPTIAGAMARLGFAPSSPTDDASAPPPTFADVILNDHARTVRLARPGVRLDFGAVAKGFALDQAAAILRSHGVAHALLHGGTSSIIAIGPPTGHRPFRVDVESAAGPTVRVQLRDAAMSVSAPRGRVACADDQTHTHILDPRTGLPPAGLHCRTAAAVAPSAALADAWTTALVVLADRPPTAPPDLTTALELDAGWSVDGPLAGAFSTSQPSPATTEAA
jgi:FAD:protein FMN transferase